MRPASRITILLVSFLIGSIALFLLGVNLYVQSKGTQARIEQELSQRLGMPLRIQRISLTPWSGLKLSGITIAGTGPAGQAFVEAKNFRLRVRWLSIFQQPLVIKEVALIHPVVVWPQDQSGKWRLPLRPKSGETPARELPGEPGAAAVPPRAMSPPAPEPIEMPAAVVGTPEIRRVKLVDGSFHFLDQHSRNVALFDDVQFRSAVRNGRSLRGEVSAGKVALRDRVFLSKLRSLLLYDGGTLELTKLSVTLAKGELSGSFAINPEEENAPFETHTQFSKIDADDLVTQAGGPAGTVRGLLEGTLDAKGKLPDAVAGSGTISLHEGHVQQLGALAIVGQLLQIDELTQLNLSRAEAQYHFEPRQIFVDQLVLQSTNLRLDCTGTIGFDGSLKLASTLTINEKIRGQLFRGIRENFVPASETGLYSLAFNISGTLARPKTDLMQRVISPELRDLGNALDSFLGRKKKSRAKPSPAAVPTP